MSNKGQPAVTRQQEQFTSDKRSPLELYRELTVGDGSWAELLKYELLSTLLVNLPGLAGFSLRTLLYPSLFKSSGKRPAFGRGVTIRNPGGISLGNKVLIDEGAVLDARINSAINLGDLVSIGRYTTLAAKGAEINLSDGVNIGSYCRIASQSKVQIGASTLVAAYCYIGPGNHKPADEEKPLIAQEMEIKGGVKVGEHVWIGTRTTVLDGVTIGDRAIVGAHSLVTKDVPPDTTVAGVPAKVLERKS